MTDLISTMCNSDNTYPLNISDITFAKINGLGDRNIYDKWLSTHLVSLLCHTVGDSIPWQAIYSTDRPDRLKYHLIIGNDQ